MLRKPTQRGVTAYEYSENVRCNGQNKIKKTICNTDDIQAVLSVSK